jgi:hypothetical protein
MTTTANAAADRWPVVLCKAESCRARIIMATGARTGATVPVDEKPGPGGTIELRIPAINGPPVAVVLPRREITGRTDLHTSHFATCADPNRFRRPR